MLELKDKNNNLRKLAEREDLDKKEDSKKYATFSTLTELEEILSGNYNRMFVGSNSKDITINGIMIYAWSKWFIPSVNVTGDMTGFVIYPNTGGYTSNVFFILGHTSGGWNIKKIV